MASSMHLSRLRKWFLASPPIEFAINNLKELLIGALRQGPIPQHVAFVMDGNRRFARSHGIETVEGHNLGFEALARVGLHRRASSILRAGVLFGHRAGDADNWNRSLKSATRVV